MAKKRTRKIIISLVILVALIVVLLFSMTTFWHEDSPDGTYQLCGWLIDMRGAGYSGGIYLRKNFLFSAWHKLGAGVSSCEWTSNSTFRVDLSYMVDGSYTTEYSVEDFFD